MTRIAVIGRGRMGALLATMVPETGATLVAHLGREETGAGVKRQALAGADVVIEFTVPTAAAQIVRDCAALGVPVVSGTTGWDDRRPDVEAAVRASEGAMLWAPNFALGVHLFARVAEYTARLFASPEAKFDAHLVETHHRRKLDAPSGTARMLVERVSAVRDGGQAIPVTSVRTGSVPGTHEFIFDAPFEQVRLVHEARDRRVFAAGAISAARWLAGRRGVFTLDDFLGDLVR